LTNGGVEPVDEFLLWLADVRRELSVLDVNSIGWWALQNE
jgi:hypothetical protein